LLHIGQKKERKETDMNIQPITANDVPTVERLAYEYNQELGPDETSKEAVLRWIAFVSQAAWTGKHFFWLACVEEHIAGFVSFQIRTNPFTQKTYGFIEDLYVIPPFRRRGYAKELVQTAFRELRQHGAEYIELDVLAHNERALAFWKKQGLTLHHYVLTRPFPSEEEQQE
jgi:ribosomal protein S18 acetylase RimI-like enzyme